MPTTVEKLVETFLHPVVTLIFRIPTYDTLVDKIYQISSNVASMQATLDGGKLGFLALTVSPTVYANLSATSFIKPANPGLALEITTNITSIEQTSIPYKFTLDTELHKLLHNMDKAPSNSSWGSWRISMPVN